MRKIREADKIIKHMVVVLIQNILDQNGCVSDLAYGQRMGELELLELLRAWEKAEEYGLHLITEDIISLNGERFNKYTGEFMENILERLRESE